ncbi:MAG: ATP-binding cassette domain-containing protein, partial [Acutalibacteraceae bacterium]
VEDMLGIKQLHKKSYRELSGGQQQRVLLARALCATGDVIVLDEPVTGLDVEATAEMYSLIERLNKSGITVLMVSHDLDAAIKYSNKILHMSHNGYFFGSTVDYLTSGYYTKLVKGK